MTGIKEYEDKLLRVLSEWSGLPPSEHQEDLWRILSASFLTYEKPSLNIERAGRIGRAATEIERVLSSMSMLDRGSFIVGFLGSEHRQNPVENYKIDEVFPFCRALKDGARTLRQFAEKAQEDRQEIKNENRRSIKVAIVLSEIYFRVTKREPPKAGTNGRFQRLLHKVYEALDLPVKNLRGPLRKVYEYRQNRHS